MPLPILSMLIIIFSVVILVMTVIMPKINAIREAVDRHRYSLRNEIMDVRDELMTKIIQPRLINGATNTSDLVCGCRHHLSFHDKRGCREKILTYENDLRTCSCTRYVGPELPTSEELAAHEQQLAEQKLLAESQANCLGKMPLL